MTKKKVITAEDVRELKKLLDTQYLTSLDKPFSDDNDATFGEFLEDDRAIDPYESALRSDIVETMHDVLDSLPARDRQIISMRYGIGFDRPMTMEEIGSEFNLSRERVRQIENSVMKILRHPSRMRKMRPYAAS